VSNDLSGRYTVYFTFATVWEINACTALSGHGQSEQLRKLCYEDLRTSPRDREYAMLAGIRDIAAEAAIAPPM